MIRFLSSAALGVISSRATYNVGKIFLPAVTILLNVPIRQGGAAVWPVRFIVPARAWQL